MKKIFLLFISLTLLSSPLFAWNKLTDNIDINCLQASNALDCSYRILNYAQPPSISAKAGKESILLTAESRYPDKNDKTAILFLVDTSDPARQKVIDKNKQHIKELMKLAKPHHTFGLASFDKMLKVEAAIGTSPFLLSKSLEKLSAKGLTTELYRNLLGAIEQLKNTKAQRKIIILFSDGQAEDKAYFHSDVVTAARKSGVFINSIGYPRSISLSVALQTLRRLSEETGGNYIETDTGYNLPASYLSNAFKNIDNGGKFSVDLENNKSDKIKLTFKTDTDSFDVSVPVKVAVPKKTDATEKEALTPIATTPLQTAPVKTAPIQVITRQSETQPVNLWLWYGLPAAFIIIIIFILIVLFLLWNRQPSSKKDEPKTEYKPYAYLIAGDENNTRYPITRTIWRIGRGKDNELTLDDTSVSRRHAEIHRNNNGTFDIIDMNSMNGIYINNEKIGKAILQEGDVIEIGDIFLHFTQLASDYSLEDSTVMQKTKTPSTH